MYLPPPPQPLSYNHHPHPPPQPYYHHPSSSPLAIPLPAFIPSPQPPSTSHPPPPPPAPPILELLLPPHAEKEKKREKKKKKVECWHESVTDGAENTKLNEKHFSINDVMSECFVICYYAQLPLLKACVCPTPDQERPACTCNLKGTQTCLPVWLGSILYT